MGVFVELGGVVEGDEVVDVNGGFLVSMSYGFTG